MKNAFTVLFALMVAAPLGVSAQASTDTYALHIERLPLVETLKELSKQTGLQVVGFLDGGRPREMALAGPLNGQYTAEAALEALLSESGFMFVRVNESTIAVTSRTESHVRPVSRAKRSAISFTQIDARQRGSDRNSVARFLPVSTSDGAEDSGANVQLDSDGDDEDQRVAVPEILVVGSRISNTDIKRTEDDAQPYVVFDRAQIDRSRAVSVEEFLKTRLPMNTLQTSNGQVAGSAFGNQSSINLRGLGEGQTLVLVDGRRMPSVNRGGTFGQPDINGLPLSSIERIEVLPSTASGIYGGGATGGVVNIITRRSTGLEISVDYGNTLDTDVASRRFDASLGLELEGGRSYLQIIGSHAETNELLTGERDFAARAIALQAANNPDELSAFAPPFGSTSNICAATPDGICGSDPLVLDNGVSLGSNRTFVPAGYAGAGSDGGAALVGNAGRYNLDIPNTGIGRQVVLLSNPTVKSMALNARRTFTPSIEAFIDSSWYENESASPFSANSLPYFTMLAADAPNNPFNSDVLVNFPAVGLGNAEMQESTTKTLRTAAGVIVRLPHGWTAGADYVWSRSQFSTSYTEPLVGDPTGTGDFVDIALADGTLDVMRDTNAFPLDFSPYLLPSGNSRSSADTELNDAALRMSGPIFQLPGGAVTLSSQVAWRKEEADASFQDRITASNVPRITYRPGASQKVNSYYLEGRAPLFSKTNATRFMQGLELQASVRHEAYTTRAPNPRSAILTSRDAPRPAVTYSSNDAAETNFTLGLRYSPLNDVTLRASFGTGFLPPSLLQIGAPTVRTNILSITDPKRGGAAASTTFSEVSGANADLHPEESESWSLGAIFTPSFLSGLRLSVDYTRIEKTDEIRSLQVEDIVSLEDLLPGRVTRAPLTPADAALGYTGGVITAIDRSFVNVAESRIEAYDFQLDYTWQTNAIGDFQWYAIATYQPNYDSQIIPATPFLEAAGYGDGPLKWRGNAGLTWSRNAVTFGWNAQYYDSYFIFPASADPATTEFYIDYYTLNQGSITVPSQTYHDVFARYHFDGAASTIGNVLSNVEITFGVQNVLDKSPPILATTLPFGGYSTYGDPRMRRYSVTVRKKF